MKYLIATLGILAFANDQLLLNDPNIIFDSDEGSISTISKTKAISKYTKIKKYCAAVNNKLSNIEIRKTDCENTVFLNVRDSFLGYPLVWFKSGLEKLKSENEVVLISCGFYGNEETTVKFCFDIIEHLKKNQYDDKFFVVTPIVNPDSFLKPSTKRTNQRTVDLLRNYPHDNWQEAINHWTKEYEKELLFNPGARPRSEKETVFLTNLIKRYRPMKVIAVTYKQKYKKSDYTENTLTKKLGNEIDMDLVLGPNFPGSLGKWTDTEGIVSYNLFLEGDEADETEENKKVISTLLRLI